jgi:hypothetical protein
MITQAREIQQILKNEGESLAKRKWFLVKRYRYLLKGVFKNFLIKLGLINKKYSGVPLSLRKNNQQINKY